jgi:hypothetical protein
MTDTSNDLTAIFYTAEVIPSNFALEVRKQLKTALPDDVEQITLVQQGERSHFNIYRIALEGVKMAKTKYVALCEDDVLYSPEHFKYRPKNKPFAYNFGVWNIFTWDKEPIFHFKGGGRINLGNLICERQAFIDAMEERFAKYPNPDPNDQHLKDRFAEPGKYEGLLGVTKQEFEVFYTNPPNIKFSHENELSFQGLGTRKRAGEIRAYSVPYWGEAKTVRELYQ